MATKAANSVIFFIGFSVSGRGFPCGCQKRFTQTHDFISCGQLTKPNARANVEPKRVTPLLLLITRSEVPVHFEDASRPRRADRRQSVRWGSAHLGVASPAILAPTGQGQRMVRKLTESVPFTWLPFMTRAVAVTLTSSG